MRQMRLVPLVAALIAVGILSGCGQPTDPAAAGDETSSRGNELAAAGAQEDPDGLTLIYPTWGIGADSLADLLANDVTFVGTVIREADGPEFITDEPGAQDNERRRLVTVRVDTLLAGDPEVESVVLYTFGWAIPDGPEGEAIPITPEGVPWLDVGEQVFISAEQGVEEDYVVYNPPAADGAFEIVDGRLVEPYGGSDSPIWAEVGGLTVDELAAKVRALQ